MYTFDVPVRCSVGFRDNIANDHLAAEFHTFVDKSHFIRFFLSNAISLFTECHSIVPAELVLNLIIFVLSNSRITYFCFHSFIFLIRLDAIQFCRGKR